MTVLLALAGCGDDVRVLDDAGLERAIAADLARQTGERPLVRCPDGREARAGVVVRCELRSADGTRSAARVTVLGDDGRLRFELLPGDAR